MIDQQMADQQITNQQIPQPILEEAVQQQREAFAALVENLGQAPSAEIRRALTEREEITPEPELNPEAVARLRQRIADALARSN
jgi:hypothetical protein